MPFHLFPSVTRRDFLGGIGALACTPVSGVVSKICPPGISESGSPFTLALLSDTHIAADVTQMNLGQNMASNLQAVVKDILSQQEPPLAAFINGDLALKDGQEGDYQQLLTLLGPLREGGFPIHLGLGNHDNRDHFQSVLKDPLKLHPVEISKYLSEVILKFGSVEAPIGIRLVVLDSLNKVNVAAGLIGTDQLLWLKDRLDGSEHATMPTIVLVHHDPSDQPNALIDSDALLRMLSPRTQVKALVFGHTHVWSTERRKDGLWLVNLPAIAYPFSNDQPLGWVRAFPQAAGVVLELRAIGGNRSRDGQKVELAWR